MPPALPRGGAALAIRAFLVRAALPLCLGLGLCGCSPSARLADELVAVGRHYADAQDRALLLNILRRSAGQPAHFTALRSVRGRSRAVGDARLVLPVGPLGLASTGLQAVPGLLLREGMSYELVTQTNREFEAGYQLPVDAEVIHSHLRSSGDRALVLTLMLERIVLHGPGGAGPDGAARAAADNAPGRPGGHEDFAALLERLLDQGLDTEEAELARDVGPVLRAEGGPEPEFVLKAHGQGLHVERVDGASGGAARRFRLRKLVRTVRFCFHAPAAAPLTAARCGGQGVTVKRFREGDGLFFGTADRAAAVLDAGGGGRLELHTRSLSGIMDFLGAAVRVQLRGGAAPGVRAEGHAAGGRTAGGRTALLVVAGTEAETPGAIAATFAGRRYVVPAGAAGGRSGDVLSLVSRLLAQVQSVRDLPRSDTLTLVPE